ncbi:hypothetical protein VSR68_06780 [Paraburkholderia phymatum]|uniref:carboxymuconolactone decarboxylase family protein n=1 Tax=Paraburkholderia phymatum TaxID=148447 RepID=UPI0031713926
MAPVRFPALNDDEMSEPQRALMARIRAFSTASASGPFPMLLRSPALGECFLPLSHYLRFETRVPEPLAELAILIHARLGCDRYEWDMHVRRGLAVGIDASVIDDLLGGRKPEGLSPAQNSVYRFCVQLLQQQRVDDSAFADAVALLGDAGVVDLTVTLGMYSMLSKVLAVAEVSVQTNSSGPLPALREPLPD